MRALTMPDTKGDGEYLRLVFRDADEKVVEDRVITEISHHANVEASLVERKWRFNTKSSRCVSCLAKYVVLHQEKAHIFRFPFYRLLLESKSIFPGTESLADNILFFLHLSLALSSGVYLKTDNRVEAIDRKSLLILRGVLQQERTFAVKVGGLEPWIRDTIVLYLLRSQRQDDDVEKGSTSEGREYYTDGL